MEGELLPLLQRRGNRKCVMIDMLILNISSAGVFKGEMAYGDLKQSSASPVRLPYKIKNLLIVLFKRVGILSKF